MLQWSIESSWFRDLKDKDRIFILSVYAERPTISRNSMLDGTAPAMSELIESKEFDDRDLLDSLLRFCFGFLVIFKNHRELITSNRRVKARLEIAESEGTPDIDWHFLHPNWDDYNEIFNAIVISKDQTLIERLLMSNQRFEEAFLSKGRPDSLEELFIKLKTCIRGVGSLCFTDKLNEKAQYVTFEQLDIRSLLSPCESEEICLRWMLGIDRIQQAGQQKLTLEDIDITPTHATISFLKRRSNEHQKESTSHKKKTYNYQIIKYIHDLRKEFEKNFSSCDINAGKLFQHESPFARRQHKTSISYRPIILACTPGTNLYEAIVTMFPQSQLFQEYFRTLIDENSEARREAFVRIRSKDQSKPNKSEGLHTLSANVIAQSRAIVDPKEPITLSAFDRHAKAEAAADGTAHSIKTNQEIYKNRSQTPHRLGQRAKFVATVGKLQEEDARRLSVLLSNTEFISLSEVNDLLGWEVSSFKTNDIEEFNRMVNSAEKEGYNCSPFGWLSKQTSIKRIIILTPVTAALILSFIKGCQIELKYSNPEARTHSIIMQLCYAKMVLNNFDSRTIADGQLILKEYDIPPAVI